MTLETIQSEMIQALKDGNKFRKQVLSDLVCAVKKAAIDKKCKDNIPETLVYETLLKYKKMVQEQIDTCPTERAQMLENYKDQIKIVAEFAPTLITDETEIRYLILDIVNNEHEFSKSNRGIIMKILAPVLKNLHVDMCIASKVVEEILV